MGRRHKLDIYADILRLATNGTRTTKLVYQANTNFTNIKRYLEALSEKGLIMFNDGHPHTTEKGSEFLERYEELMHVFNPKQTDEIGEDPDADEANSSETRKKL